MDPSYLYWLLGKLTKFSSKTTRTVMYRGYKLSLWLKRSYQLWCDVWGINEGCHVVRIAVISGYQSVSDCWDWWRALEVCVPPRTSDCLPGLTATVWTHLAWPQLYLRGWSAGLLVCWSLFLLIKLSKLSGPYYVQSVLHFSQKWRLLKLTSEHKSPPIKRIGL